MAPLPAPETEARRILELARKDRPAARAVLRELPIDLQVAAICELPVAARARLIELLPNPERVIPRLPEAELCFTAKAVGLADAGWILEHATNEQIQACFDLDAWRADALDPAALERWFDAVADAGEETLLRGVHAIDPEILYLFLRGRLRVEMKPNDEGWQPEPGSQSIEGQFFFGAIHGGDDLETISALLGRLFESDYWLYFRMMQAIVWEDAAENEEFALRWRRGRLEDLGFPPIDEAIGVYAHLREEKWAEVPEGPPALVAEDFHLPVYPPKLPVGLEASHLLFRAAAELDSDERSALFFAFISLANHVAVADRMPLGDAESIPTAIEKAARVASIGLEHLARVRAESPASLLRRVAVAHLFRVGANLERTGREPQDAPR